MSRQFFSDSQDVLCCKLTDACPNSRGFAPLRKDMFTIFRKDISLQRMIGAGKFGEVWKGPKTALASLKISNKQ